VTPLANDTSFAATTAWRAIPSRDGGLVVTHQRALETTVDPGVDVGADLNPGGVTGSTGYGSRFTPCGSIVQGTMTTVTSEGTVVTHAAIPSVGLPVDAAVSPTGLVAIANGSYDPTAPIKVFSTPLELVAPPAQDSPSNCGNTGFVSGIEGTITSVTYDSAGNLLALMREPSVLFVYDEAMTATSLALGGADVKDTGHTLFHADSSTGIACASCHAEGGDDGHVWNFLGIGQRRTQALDVGLEGTAPFHWDGDLASFDDLVHDVLEHRMGGPLESPEHIAALERTVYGFRRRPPARDAGDESALRGKVLFESEDIGCATCHTGPTLTKGETADIGRGATMQIPSLVGIASRPPYMHDGCATTLLGRFDPACGGSEHGHTELLDDAALADLISYLETL
jgi:mono/diheme cytochrome c family protein